MNNPEHKMHPSKEKMSYDGRCFMSFLKAEGINPDEWLDETEMTNEAFEFYLKNPHMVGVKI